MNFVWSKYLNSGSGVKQKHQQMNRWTDAAEQSGSIENPRKKMKKSLTVIGGKVRRRRQIQRDPFQPSSSWRKTIETCKKRWRKTLGRNCRRQLCRIKTVELSWNTWRSAVTSYHFSVTRVKQLEHHSQKLAEQHETSLTKVTQPDGNNQDPLKNSQRMSFKNYMQKKFKHWFFSNVLMKIFDLNSKHVLNKIQNCAIKNIYSV